MGFFISTKQSIIVIVAFVSLVVAVGLLAGLINPPGDLKGGSNDGQVGDGSTTSKPTEATTSATTPPGPTERPGPWQHPFLPNNTEPLHYDLSMVPDHYYNGNTFSGSVSITINVTDATRYLIVHYKAMNITKTTVTLDAKELAIDETFGYSKNQFWVTELTEKIPANSVVRLYLEFNGSLVNGIVGYYKSTYYNSLTNKESWLATTKFQPTDARKAFPNFDEPHYKATYTVTLRHWSNFTALSNMPVHNFTQDLDDPAWTTTLFQKSHPMSSYLVCFIVCDFDFVETTFGGGKPHRIWAAPDKMDQARYALRVGTDIANFFEQEFHMTFHLPKLDQVAVPDYPSGATEHWGLITYRETSLLYNETLASASAKDNVAQVIGHELAHNYFGNAVTCDWWDDIWLNEGFAIFYQYIGLQTAEPTWQAEDYFAVDTQQSIMQTDAGTSSRPVVVEVTDPDGINQAFDGITYNKGASVLRMIESFMGKTRFRTAIREYLKKHEYGTVVTKDLWAALQEEMGLELDITAVMRPWTEQMGLPVLKLTEDAGQITATPKRFLQNPDADPSQPESQFGYEWYIPLTYNTSSGEAELVWINKTARTFPNPRPAGGWVKFNREQRGFYRVNYPQGVWDDFAGLLVSNHEVFSPVDRSNLLDDGFNLARATQLGYPTALGLTKYMNMETEYFPWRSAYSAINYINNQLYGAPDYHLWRRYIRELSSGVMDRLQVNAPDSEHLDNMLRLYIIRLSCNNGYTPCLDNTSAIFSEWIHDTTGVIQVPPNIRQEVYMYGMREVGNEAEWDLMWQRFEAAQSAQEALNLLRGMAQAPQLYLLERYLSYCMDENKVRSQDFFSAVTYAAASPYGEVYVWSWLREVYPQLVDRFGVQDRYFGRLVPDIVSNFKTEFRLNEVKEFFALYPDAGAGETPRRQAIEAIENNIKWRDLNEEAVFDWLRNYYKNSS